MLLGTIAPIIDAQTVFQNFNGQTGTKVKLLYYICQYMDS